MPYQRRIRNGFRRSYKKRVPRRVNTYQIQYFKFTVSTRFTLKAAATAYSRTEAFELSDLYPDDITILTNFAYVKLYKVRFRFTTDQNAMQAQNVQSSAYPNTILYVHVNKAQQTPTISETNMIQAMSSSPKPIIINPWEKKRNISFKPWSYEPVNFGSYGTPVSSFDMPCNKWLLTDSNGNWKSVNFYRCDMLIPGMTGSVGDFPVWFYYKDYYVAAKGLFQDY